MECFQQTCANTMTEICSRSCMSNAHEVDVCQEQFGSAFYTEAIQGDRTHTDNLLLIGGVTYSASTLRAEDVSDRICDMKHSSYCQRMKVLQYGSASPSTSVLFLLIVGTFALGFL